MASYDFGGAQQWGQPLYSMGGASQNMLPQVAPAPPPVQSTWDHSSPYRLTVKQQPERAKAANAKDKDRKPVDPPPIVQLDVDPSLDPLQVYITSPYLFVQTFLIGASSSDPEPELNSLTGNTCTSGHVVKDDRGAHNMMFCLNDISVKKEGTYRLKFCLFKLNTTSGDAEALTSICSQPFTTYSGRHFPGMSESTSMTRLLVDAGVRLRLRKESKAMSTKKKNNAFAQMMGGRNQGGGGEEEEDRPVKRVRSEPGDKDNTMSLYPKHGSFSTTHSYTGHSTPSTTMTHYPGAFHTVTSSPSQSMAPIGSMSGHYGSNLQLGLDTSVGHYHSPPSAGSSYQSPGRQSPSTAYPLHGSATSSQGLLTGASPLGQFSSSHAAAHGPVLPPVDKIGASHGSSSPDLNYTTAANYNGGYMPTNSSSSRTLPGMHAQRPGNSIVGPGGLHLKIAQPGLPHGQGGYGESNMFDNYNYGSRDGH
ncbi:hypothetical protein M406DRAFT_74569 [Cryphonectria parasitica EP155]|uniref:Velvet domain-containing protein n=1 Tax=Cryphonectria parasitica (strain ATCC 38755 / EP155) TaxID=660469 RepID=A0A9P5CL37_CRYP1|nr:uncharacterized protein M406DRAFT_74569 [Cryphonectria parasitica EP155]KAF3761616.1 hypothetical protein M406DRAFT_74569 [Cryphonectria parasitica EP155]